MFGRLRWGMASVLTLGMVLVITLLTVVLTVFDVRQERTIFRDELQERGRLLTAALNDILADPLYHSDVDKLRDIAQVVGSEPDITYVQIFNPQGRILVDPLAGGTYPTGAMRDDLELSAISDGQPRMRFEGNDLEVIRPIVIGSDVLGVARFGFDGDELGSEISGIILRHVWQGLALIAAGVALAFMVARYATRPLQALATVARQIGLGNLTTSVPTEGTRETVALGHAMEGMRVELARLYLNLEGQVAERTEELSKTNEELQQEIQERRRTEDALKQAEDKYRTIFERSAEGIFQTTPEGRFLSANPAMARICGYESPEELIEGLTDLEGRLYVEPGMRVELFRQIEENGALSNVELPLYHKDGTAIWTSESVRAVRDDNGRVTYYEGSVVDITERKQAEKQLERLYQEVSASRERLQALSTRLVEVQEAERRHLARELHDEIGQVLTGLQLTLESGKRGPAGDAVGSIEQAQKLVSGLMERVRELSLDLRPAMLDDLGLVPALLWYFERYTSQTDVRVDFNHDGLKGRFGPEVETAAFRIVQEALTNVARHAGVDEVKVLMRPQKGGLVLEVSDAGVGFEENTTVTRGASGLVGMKERAALLGGEMLVHSTPGTGSRLTARMPLDSLSNEGNGVGTG